MTKLIPILSGRCLVVELQEGANRFTVFNDDRPYLSFFVNAETPRVYLPEGNWRIIGMLSEVTELEAATLVESRRKLKDWGFTASYGTYYFNYSAKPVYAEFDTALESLESAILAEGWYFENPIQTVDDNYAAIGDYYHNESRVLDRSRCLLLGREI